MAYTVNYLGDFAALVALAVLVYDQTQSALATSGLFVASQFVPALLAPLLTARMDRVPPGRALPILYAAEAGIFGALALSAASFVLGIVYVLVMLDGILMLSARALTRATVNEVLGQRGLLQSGNALLNVGFAVAGVVGAALGGVLVGAFGAGTVLAVDAATFLAIALITVTLPTLAAKAPDERGLLSQVREGFGFAARDPALRLLIGGETLAIVFFALIVPIEVVYAKETLETTDTGYGALLATWSAGVIAGSLVFASTSASPRRIIIAATAMIGLAYVGMAVTTLLVVACAFALLGGVGNGIQWVAVVTAVQRGTPDALQARITGLLESAASIATGIGFLLGGIVVTLLSPPAAFAVAGAGTLALVAVAVALKPRRRPAAPSGGA